MRIRTLILCYICFALLPAVQSQSIAQVKKELETTPDPIGYVKFKLKKKYTIDTVTIISTTSFTGLADSIAYKGKTGKVYGPFKKGNYLLKILMKAPNTFYHVNHILLDTATFNKKFATSLADSIIAKVKSGQSSFESMARTYSSDNFSISKGGDLGWFCRGIMLPQLDAAIISHKKGDIFTVWTDSGLHIVTIKDNPKKDDGFVLMLRVFL